MELQRVSVGRRSLRLVPSVLEFEHIFVSSHEVIEKTQEFFVVNQVLEVLRFEIVKLVT